ncbi:glycosyltransferase family 2 protein [Rhizobium sp. ARZ01]|uniref:glycosyltransferase family 2 protein n=1 Tax=Rhizobium sp. ARZ01 TaxID=2769313 RepID=UPI00177DF182|nr:glycosyltransferase family 2 protein [Rhizobium sp. ARZ01]MBD9374398.1 glycosyltransferase family 2 protein [Rhizobium sp. ARZ01]
MTQTPASPANALQRPDLSIIVVSYNTAEMTIAALQSVLDTSEGVNLELLVCDNESPDGSADMIEAAFVNELGKRVHLVRSGGNLGFGRANNLMADMARGRRILLLNPDTIVLANALQSLLAFAERTPWAQIWGGRTYDGKRQLDPSSIWARMSVWSVFCYAFGLQKIFPRSAVFNSEAYGGFDRQSEREVDIVSGCYLLIDTDLWHLLGGFDPRFYMYAEEADLCLRARVFGARPRFTPASEIIHFGGASDQIYSGKMVKLFAGKMTLAQKHWPAWQLRLARVFMGLAVWLRARAVPFLGMLTGRERWKKAGAEWRIIWQRRKDWMDGYPDPS